jgi:Ca2+-dependent lipid-binding protein
MRAAVSVSQVAGIGSEIQNTGWQPVPLKRGFNFKFGRDDRIGSLRISMNSAANLVIN